MSVNCAANQLARSLRPTGVNQAGGRIDKELQVRRLIQSDGAVSIGSQGLRRTAYGGIGSDEGVVAPSVDNHKSDSVSIPDYLPSATKAAIANAIANRMASVRPGAEVLGCD